MNNKFTDLVDIEKIHTLLQSFHRLTGINSSITDTEGNLHYVKDGSLLGAGWTQICVNFHRVHPETRKRCVESDTVLSQKLNEGENYACYECLNGLIDVAVPIKIGDKHIVNLFMGQFFFQKPNIKFFKKQAAKYNFDEAKYLKALSEVPIFSKEKIAKALEFLKNLAELIIEMGASHKELLEISEELEQRVQKRTAHLQKALDEIKTLRGILPLCSFCKKVRNDEGYWEQVDIYIHKYSQADISHSICPECLKEHYPEYAK